MRKRVTKGAGSRASRSAKGDAPITPLKLPSHVKTVVVFGGSFDPPHFMHVVGPLTSVVPMYGPKEGWLLYVPAARSPHKSTVVASDDHRLAMLRLAIDLPGPRSIWTDELDRARWSREHRRKPSPSYTIETLRRLRSIVPARVRLRLLIGSDQVCDFHRWREPREIIRLAEPLVMAREPSAWVSSIYSSLAGDFWTREERRAWCARVAPNFPLEAASTSVRLAIPGAPRNPDSWKRRKVLRDIPTPVARHIIAHNLYGFREGPSLALAPENMPHSLTGDAPDAMERVRRSVLSNLATGLLSMNAPPKGSKSRGSKAMRPSRRGNKS